MAAIRARAVSATGFLRIAVSSLVVLFVVVTSGAFVRLTGSGLGCDNWPRCGDKPYPEQGFHAFVEFGNRMVALVGIVMSLVTWLASRKVDGLSPLGRVGALGAFLVAFAQIPMGGITVILELHPLAVMAHFLLGLAVLAFALAAVIEAWGLLRGLAAPAGAPWLRQVVTWLGLPLAAALVVTGAVATASGPHPGASEDVERLGVGIA
ncbi:MAG TPA: COX15/CtaA family protein, partial [Gaiellaceae bacterium]|nr:COX15/CtaA family protein [Gaiellaceae bacterium]